MDACPGCHVAGRPLSLVVDGEYRLHRCPSCGTEYFGTGTGQELPVRTYWEQYKFDIYGSPDVRMEFENRYRDVLVAAEAAIGRHIGSVLDVGCGIGNFVSYAARSGRRAVGVDVDRDAVECARRRGLSAVCPDALDTVVGDHSVDAVTLWDVIEHLSDPDEVLAAIASKVVPGGAIIIETPDASFPLRPAVLAIHRMTGGRIDATTPLYYREHVAYFTVAGLERLLRRHDCDIVSVRRLRSPRRKMSLVFAQQRRMHGWRVSGVLARVWPSLERASGTLGIGNKLIVVARTGS